LNQITFLKNLDSLLGPLLCRLLPAAHQAPLSLREIKRVLFIRPGGIGDAVLLVPAIQALQEEWPSARIDILAEKRNVCAFDLCPDLGKTFCYDSIKDWSKFFFNKYDLIVDTEQWHYLSAFIARIVRSRWRCGFATNSRRRLFSHIALYSHDAYEALSFFQLLDALDVKRPTEVVSPFLRIPSEDQAMVDGILTQVRQPFVALFPGASIAEKRWPAENFARIADFCRDRNLGVVVVGGGQDRDAALRILADGSGLNLAGELSLAQSAAVLKRCSVLVAGDSGVLHLGVGVGCQTVSLFGPAITEKWAPRGSGHGVVDLKLPCSPCARFGSIPPCSYHAKCIFGIKVEDVCEKVMALLEKN
jgi:ADP-heptose:LPS heptosyltransferase